MNLRRVLPQKEVSTMVAMFLANVAADVVAGVALYFIIKWLDKRN